jgi:ribonuclease P protein component
MLKRVNRLGVSVRFSNSYFLVTPQFILKKKQNSLSVNRFGVVVSKKIDKRAVVRNRLKRLFRDVFMGLEKTIIAKHDILMIVKIASLDKTKKEIFALVEKSFIKAGLIKNEKNIIINY